MSDIREDLKAFVDRELPQARTEEVAAAVQSDPVLQREVDEIKTLSKEIRAMAPSYQPVGMDETLARVARRSRPAGWAWPRLAWAGLAASVVLVGFLVFRGQEATPGSSLLVQGEGGRVTFDKKTAADPEFRNGVSEEGAPIESAPLPEGEEKSTQSRSQDETMTPGVATTQPGEPSPGTDRFGTKSVPAEPKPKEGAPAPEPKGADPAAAPEKAAPADVGAAGKAPSPSSDGAGIAANRATTSTERVVIVVDDIDKAKAEAMALTSSMAGRPRSERDDAGKNELLITVDEDRIAEIVDSLKKLGTVTQRPADVDKGRLGGPAGPSGSAGAGGGGFQGGLGGGGGGRGAEGGAPGAAQRAPGTMAKTRAASKVTLKLVFVKKSNPKQNVP